MSTALESPLDRLLDPLAKCLTADVAQKLIDIRPDPSTQARINELATKANDGELSAAEQTEYEGYVDAIDIVSILQVKARKFLTDRVAS